MVGTDELSAVQPPGEGDEQLGSLMLFYEHSRARLELAEMTKGQRWFKG